MLRSTVRLAGALTLLIGCAGAAPETQSSPAAAPSTQPAPAPEATPAAPGSQPLISDAFAAVAAEKAACTPVDGARGRPEGLRIGNARMLTPLTPGGEAQIVVTLVEVSGEAFMNYPSVRLAAGDPALTVVDPDGGTLYGIPACDAMEITFTLAAAKGARGPQPLRVDASTLNCKRDSICGDWHGVDLMIDVK